VPPSQEAAPRTGDGLCDIQPGDREETRERFLAAPPLCPHRLMPDDCRRGCRHCPHHDRRNQQHTGEEAWTWGEQPGCQSTGSDPLPFRSCENLKTPECEGLVQRLKWSASKTSLVDAGLEQPRKALAAKRTMHSVIDGSLPNQVPEDIEMPGIAALEVRLCEAIAFLLAKESTDGAAPVVPYNGSGTERYRLFTNKEFPAHIHVISGSTVRVVESADFLQRLFPERHVAARNMIRPHIIEKDMSGISRREIYALGDESVSRRRQVRSAYCSSVVFVQRDHQKVQPVRVRESIAVRKGHDVTLSRLDP
jgi:hypothetical protein